MKSLAQWFRRPLVQSLLAVVVVAGLLEANSRVSLLERRANSVERSAVDVAAGASSAAAMKARVKEMEAALTSAEDPLRIVERIAEGQGLKIASSTSGGVVAGENYDGIGHRVRVEKVSLAPLARLLNEVEAARSDLIIRELVVRRSIQNPRRLDADFEIHVLMPKKSTE